LTKVKQEKLDTLAELEIDALIAGLRDPETKKNAAFCAAVRRFLKDNGLKTTPETPGVSKIVQQADRIPDLEDDEDGIPVN